MSNIAKNKKFKRKWDTLTNELNSVLLVPFSILCKEKGQQFMWSIVSDLKYSECEIQLHKEDTILYIETFLPVVEKVL